MITQRLAMTKMAVSLIVSVAATTPAFAARSMDYFSNVSPNANVAPRPSVPTPKQPPAPVGIGAGPMAMMSARTPAVIWFERVDEEIASMLPTQGDKVTLNRPFDQEAERVQQWTQTASKVAKNYRYIARTLKNEAVPPNCPGLSDYRNMLADWYSDAAQVYEDLIKPRRPARTYEELKAGLDEIEQRANALANTNKSLLSMDQSLRSQYRVHYNRTTDPLYKYVAGKQ